MRSLFSKIYQLAKNKETDVLEDYLTEIFSKIFNIEGVTKQFLEYFDFSIGEVVNEPTDILVETQVSYKRLINHDEDSRPDIVLKFTDSNKRYTVFIENKIGSEEGDGQLEKYADQLENINRNDGSITFLLYITKVYEPKNVGEIVGVKPVIFKQLRWQEIYGFLKGLKENFYIKKLIQYMEDLGMDVSRTFEKDDIQLLSRFTSIKKTMDVCFDENVQDKLKLFNQIIKPDESIKQLNWHNRYCIGVYWADDSEVWVGCGFDFSDIIPSVFVSVEVNPKHRFKNRFIEDFNAFSKERSNWIMKNEDNRKLWFGVKNKKPLSNFIEENDHVETLKQFFIQGLETIYPLLVDKHME